MHIAYLNIGSNIFPEKNLPGAIELLQATGEVTAISNTWETKSVGADGPNYLNACLSYKTDLNQRALKSRIINPIESKLGRIRGQDKFMPRTIDIDLVLFDEKFLNLKDWEYAFIVVPLAEIYPSYKNPETLETTSEAARRVRSRIWMRARPEIMSGWNRNQSDGQN